MVEDLKTNVLSKLNEILTGPLERDDKLYSVCQMIAGEVPGCDWVGFYLTDEFNDKQLNLGPFVGEPTCHLKIPFGEGVCGIAASGRKTFVVDDVSKESRYISCSPNVRSEVVVPIVQDGKLVAVLDIDSHKQAAFTGELTDIFEAVCKELVGFF